jgi:hypothetical protein
LGRTILAGVCTVRVPTAGDCSWHIAPDAGRVHRDLLVGAFDDGRATGEKD